MSRGDRSRPARERTPEERERDREERERRRAGRTGGDAPPPEPAEAQGTSEPNAPDPVPEPSAREPEPQLPAPPAPQPTPPEPDVPPEPELPPPAPAERPSEVPQPSPSAPAAFTPPPAPPPPVAEPSVPAPPLPPPEGPRSGDAAPPLPRGGGPRRKWLARLAALVALLAAVVAVFLLLQSLFSSSSSKPPPTPAVIKVVIPEGETRAQIAQIAKRAGLSGSYRLASRRSPLLDPAHYGAPHDTPDLEGFLFPATYDANEHGPVSRLVEQQLVAFQENFGVATIARAHALHITPYELLIVASMVEREAQIPGDRAKIAAVIYNRLKAGMPLGIDASIYYAVEQREGVATYTHELTEAQLHIDSPYNTRTHTGLPPTPISNPGVASIEAAAHPAHVPYLYYVAGADGCGEQVFSTSLATFEADAAAYHAAVKANGGHPPACKHK